MKRKLSILFVLARMLTLTSGITFADIAAKTKIRVNMQAGVSVAEAWVAVEAGYEAIHPEEEIIIDLKADEGYMDWIKAQ